MADPRVESSPGSANEELQNRTIRHLLYLTRLQNAEAERVIRELNDEVIPELVARLRSRLDRIAERGYDTGPNTTRRLEELLAGLREITRNFRQQTLSQLNERLAALAVSEAEFNQRILPVGVETTLPAAGLLREAVLERAFDGMVLSDWFDRMEESAQVRLERAIRQGLIEGQTTDQIVRAVRGTRSAGYADGILAINTRQAEAIVRSAVIHASVQARQAFFEQNADILRGVQWVSTLDARTCTQCMYLDGRVYPLSSGPRPPVHVNCRCTMTPVLKSGSQIPGLPPATRASMNGQVPDDITYGEWLRRQPRDVIVEALGPTRAELFIQGKLPVTSFVNRRGRQWTLDELRRREGLPGGG